MAEKLTKTGLPYKNQEWLDLCTWVEKELFQYDGVTQKLKTAAALVLQGLRKGQHVANNKAQSYGNYPYDVILMTFKVNKNTILDAIRGKDFNGSESTKMRYICAIIRDKIDDVYTRYMNTKKSEEKIEKVNTESFEYQGAEYRSKTNEKPNKLNDKFEELW